MKKSIIIGAFVLLHTSLFAMPHNLRDHGLVAGLNKAYTSAQDPSTLAPIITQYYKQVSQGKYDISFQDLKKLYDELTKVLCKDSRTQL